MSTQPLSLLTRILYVPVLLGLSACGYEGREDQSAAIATQASTSQAISNEQVIRAAPVASPANASVPGFDSDPNFRKVALKAGDLGPANMCEGSITHSERVLIPPVAKPPYRKYYKDPAFGARVIRITNSAFGEVNKPAYSTMQAWNADESLMILYRGGKGNGYHVLHDGHTYEPLKKFDFVPSDLEEVFWSHSDPDTFFYVSKYSRDFGELKQYSIQAGRAKTIANFRNICGVKGLPIGGGDVHMQAMNDDDFGFRCRKDDGKYVAFTYKISTGETNVIKIGEGTKYKDWTAPMPGPSGERWMLQGDVLSKDLQTVEHKLDMAKAWEHSNIGLTHDGQDALYQVVFDPSPKGCNGDLWQGVGHLVEHNMETGTCRPIITELQGYPYTTSSTHASARSYLRPGWVTMSSIGFEDQFRFFSNKRKAPSLLSEIYLANTDPDNQVTCRLAHHRSFGKMAKKGDYPPYFGEPHATSSPSGTRIVFGSDWYDSGSVDSYVIELPGYQRPQ